MKGLEIKNKIESALSEVLKNDECLFKKDLNERTSAHKLATYLQSEFPDYNVDCEYNGNVLRDNGKKYIDILKWKLRELRLLRKKEGMSDKIIIERLVYPDIIIHKRGTTENLCIIEIKKSTSSEKLSRYDECKLECYTSSGKGNDLNYKLGVFIKFLTGISKPDYNLKWYRNGKEIPEKTLVSIANLTDA